MLTSVSCLQDDLGTVGLKDLEASDVLKDISKAVKAYAEDENRRNDAALQTSLMSLGLLADANAATELIRRFTDMGVINADAVLTMLNFNAALTGESE